MIINRLDYVYQLFLALRILTGLGLRISEQRGQ